MCKENEKKESSKCTFYTCVKSKKENEKREDSKCSYDTRVEGESKRREFQMQSLHVGGKKIRRTRICKRQ